MNAPHAPFFPPIARDANGPTYAPAGHGVISLANENRFVEANFLEGVTEYCAGLPVAAQTDLDALCARVPVPRRFSYREYDAASALASETDDVRAIGADFKRVEYPCSEVIDATLNKGLCMLVDQDETSHEGWQNWAAAQLKQRLILNDLHRAVVLFSAGSAADATWDGSAGQDPDQEVTENLRTSLLAGGVKPTHVFYGNLAWQKRCATLRAQSSGGGFAGSMMDEDTLAGILGVEAVHRSRTVYQTETGPSEVIGNKVFIYAKQEFPTTMDMSNIKRFVTPIGKGDFRVYCQQISAKQFVISVEHYSLIAAARPAGLICKTIS